MTAGAFSLVWISQGLLASVMGGLNDRFGPRLVLTVCGGLIGAGWLLTSQISAVWQLYLFYGVIVGAGLGGTFVPAHIDDRAVVRRETGSHDRLCDRRRRDRDVCRPADRQLVDRHLQLAHVLHHPRKHRARGHGHRRSVPEARSGADGNPAVRRERTAGPPGQRHGRRPFPEGGRVHQAVLDDVRGVFLLWIRLVRHPAAPRAARHRFGDFRRSAAALLSVIGGASVAGKVLLGGLADRTGYKQMYVVSFILLSVSLFWLVPVRQLWALVPVRGRVRVCLWRSGHRAFSPGRVAVRDETTRTDFRRELQRLDARVRDRSARRRVPLRCVSQLSGRLHHLCDQRDDWPGLDDFPHTCRGGRTYSTHPGPLRPASSHAE